MQLNEREREGVSIITLSGRLEIGDGDEKLREKINNLLDRGKKLVLLDMNQCTYMDAAGLGQIVRSYTSVSRVGGTLSLLNVDEEAHDLLSIAKLLTVFKTYEDEDEAIREMKAR